MVSLSPANQRAELSSLGVTAAKGIVAAHQAAHLQLTQHSAELKVSLLKK
jgi:hypothetical protein